MGPLGFRELLIIVFLIVILFGARRIPELMRSLGTGFREFKQGISGADENPPTQKEIDQEEKKHS